MRRSRTPRRPAPTPKLAEVTVKTVSQTDADLVTKADLKAELATLKVRLTAVGHRLAFAVVVANTTNVFGLLEVLTPG